MQFDDAFALVAPARTPKEKREWSTAIRAKPNGDIDVLLVLVPGRDPRERRPAEDGGLGRRRVATDRARPRSGDGT